MFFDMCERTEIFAEMDLSKKCHCDELCLLFEANSDKKTPPASVSKTAPGIW